MSKIKKRRKIIPIVVGIVVILLLVFGVYWFYKNIHTFAYLSTKASCEGWSEEYINELGYATGGTFIVEDEELIIEVYIGDPRTLKHEKIHYQQYLSGRLYSCETLFLRYINEIEAYMMERLDSKTLNFIYNTDYFISFILITETH